MLIPLAVDQALDQQRVGPHMEYLEDLGGLMDLAQVRDAPDDQWRRHSAESVHFRYSTSTYWLRFHLQNKTLDTLHRWLELNWSMLDEVSFYLIRDSQLSEQVDTGDHFDFQQRPVEHRHFIFPISLEPGLEYSVYLKVRTDGLFFFYPKLWDIDAFEAKEHIELLLLGAFFGVMLIMIVYNLFVFSLTKERAFLTYVFFVGSMTLFQLVLHGLGYQYLWSSTSFQAQALTFSSALAYLSAGFFIIVFLKLKQYAAYLYKAVMAAVVGWAFFAILGLSFAERLIMPLTVPLVVVSGGLALIAGAYVWMQGVRTAAYFTVAWSILLAGTLCLVLMHFGLGTDNFLALYGQQIGSLIVVVLLSFAMAERINEERSEKQKAEKLTLSLQRQATQTLESKVKERTNELQNVLDELSIAYGELEKLSMTDQVTGLRNKRFFEEKWQEEFSRALRNRRSLCVMLLEIDDFRLFVEEHGSMLADKCLTIVGEHVSSAVNRPYDAVCRYAGEKFAVLLPDTDPQGCEVIIRKVTEHIGSAEIPVSDGEVTVTATMGAAAMVPSDEVSAKSILLRAEEALYEAKESTDCHYRISL